MGKEFSPFDIVQCLNASANARNIMDWAKKLVTDPDRKNRLKESECVLCYYNNRVGGSLWINNECKNENCKTKINSENTNCDILCLECAKKMHVCKHCGADLELKNRQKLYKE